ncbi:hypothetical protein JCM21900_000523 [Sporobolomyces salmonicolor]
MASMQLFDDDLDFSGTPAPVQAAPAAPAVPATILVVASQQAAQDGSYQALVQDLAAKGKVEMQMVDRIVDGATALSPLQYSHISLLLPTTLITNSLLALVEPALAQGGALEVKGEAAESEDVLSELRLVGLAGANKTGGAILATKPAVTSIALSLKKRPASEIDNSAPAAVPLASSSNGAVPLPSRTSRAAKASLWAFTTASASSGTSTPTIDESSLLTPADLERPTLVKRADCDVKRTRKACKNCTCGLREILLDEKEPDDLVQAGFEAAPNTTVTKPSTAGARKIKSGVTSSCGNCYLGDAFRCGSCPYLGMPAFEPGQKVTISGLDDTI